MSVAAVLPSGDQETPSAGPTPVSSADVRSEDTGRAVSLLVVATVAPTIRAFMLPYARHYRERGWRVDACATDAPADASIVDAFDHVYDLGLSRSIRDATGFVRAWRRLESVLAGGYDIVHVHTPIAGFLTRLIVRRLPGSLRPATVYTAHGFHFHDAGARVTNLVFETAERVAGRWTDRLVVINQQDLTAARRARIVPAERLRLMPGIGVDTDWYSQERVGRSGAKLGRVRLEIPADAAHFVVVGELSARKRPLDVAGALSRMREPAFLTFLGDGPERAAVETTVADLGLTDRVRLPGAVADVSPIVADATAVVLASGREGLPRSIMEALSLEVPVITTDIRGSRDLVSEREGIVVPVGDVDALAAAMDALASDADRRARLGANGRSLMTSQYDLRILLAAHDELYAELLDDRPATRASLVPADPAA